MAGKLFLSLFFLVFAGMGALFTVLLLNDAWREFQSRGWPEVPCRIMASSADPAKGGDGDYAFQVRYEYRWEGQLLESTRWQIKERRFSDYGEAQALVDRYAAGRDARCRVNPASPTTAILEHGSLTSALFVFLPLIFVVIGVGGLFFAWRGGHGATGAAADTAPLSARVTTATKGRWLLVPFFGIFFVVGCVFLYLILIRPLLQIQAARAWTEVPCVIESSRVRSHSDSDGATYSVDILYRYEFGGQTRRANRYSFSTGSSSGRAGKQDVVKQYPAGRQTVCFVNPANPTEAVLHRGFTSMMWFGLIPLVFVIVGAGGMIFAVRSARSAGRLRDPATTATLRAGSLATGDEPRELKPATSPVVQVVAAALITLFWNGIVSVFVYQAITSFARGRPEWFLMIFLIPFMLIGVIIFGAFIYSLMAVFNPRPQLTVTPGTGRLGADLRVAWRFTGAVHRLQRLRVTLEGRESATYRRGTNTTTDTSVFARVTVADTTDRATLSGGNATARLPLEGVAGSFQAKNNKLQWFLIVRGTIGRWPDVAVEFPYEMRPGAAPTAALAPAPVAAGETEPERSAAGHARIGVRGGRRVFAPGDVIEGVAGWSREKAPFLAEARLLWFTRGKGTPDVTVVEPVKFPTTEREAVQPFRFTLPDGPVSFEGTLVAVNWAVELVLEPGAEAASWEFQLTPGAAPARLAALPDERFEHMKQWYARFRRQR